MSKPISPAIKDMVLCEVIAEFRKLEALGLDIQIPGELAPLILSIRNLDELYDTPETEIPVRQFMFTPLNII